MAGWGKDSVDGSFNFIQNKVDVPLVDFNTCDNAMRRALQNAGQNARNFRLSRSEVCAGGQAEKDACDGDGGAPLVRLVNLVDHTCMCCIFFIYVVLVKTNCLFNGRV